MASKMKWINEKDVALIREMSQERQREKKWCHQQKVIDEEQGLYKSGKPGKLAFLLEICMNPEEWNLIILRELIQFSLVNKLWLFPILSQKVSTNSKISYQSNRWKRYSEDHNIELTGQTFVQSYSALLLIGQTFVQSYSTLLLIGQTFVQSYCAN